MISSVIPFYRERVTFVDWHIKLVMYKLDRNIPVYMHNCNCDLKCILPALVRLQKGVVLDGAWENLFFHITSYSNHLKSCCS